MEKDNTFKVEDLIADYSFPRRPYDKTHTTINVRTNYFKFDFFTTNLKSYFKYVVDFIPDLPGDAFKMRRRVFHSAKRKVREIFGNFIFNSNVLYAKENRNGETEIETKVGDQDYKMIIKWVSIMETNSRESFGLIKRFFFKLIKKLKWVQMRKNFYDPRSARIAEGFNFEVWSGFRPTINMLNEGILINLNIVHRVLRNDTALDEIKKMHQRCQGDNQEYREMIQEYFKGTVVLTRYNDNKTYVIEGVDFETKPTNTFTCKGNQLSYVDYYKQKYGISISPDQPLLIHKDKKGKLIHLIPDQSFMTGMTDDMRNNFQLMSELAKHTKGSATSRVEESLSLINAIQNNENCVKEIETWGIRIINEMVSTRALRVLCGNVVMGANFEVSVDDQNLDRAMQKEMFSQPSLKNWVIVFFERDENLAEKFVMTLCDVVKTFKYNCDTPQKIPVRTTRANDWFSIIKERTGPQVQMCVCIIPGNKQKGALYKDVKRFLLSTIPIPSQVILTGTVNKDKAFRSVVNKILIQINSKIGGEPWIVKELPLTNNPVMICSWDTYAPRGKAPMLCFCATYNRNMTKYTTYVRPIGNSDEEELEECIKNATQTFVNVNKIEPFHIIVFRDSIGITQIKKRLPANIRMIKNGCLKACNKLPKITYVALNRKSNVKMFYDSSSKGAQYENCPPGTVIDEVVVEDQLSDFYLITQKTTQGVAQPVHYYLVYDDYEVNPTQLYSLIYKLCYMYFNWTGSIKIPAPCQYVKKLTQMTGEKLSDKSYMCRPNVRFENELKTLYFL